MPRILLAAIEPFGPDGVNSSWEAARLVADDPPRGLELHVVKLPCVFGESVTALRKAIDDAVPDLVIAVGQGGNRPDVTIERVAINLDDARAPDNQGNQPIDQKIVRDGPTAYFSSLPVKECVAAMLAAGIPASVSHTAGTYVCNHIAYGLAHLIATERPSIRGGFVHVPYTPLQAAKREKSVSMASVTAAEGLRVLLLAATFGDRAAAGRRGVKNLLARRSRVP